MALDVKQRGYTDHLGRAIGFPIGNQGDKGVYWVDYSLFFGAYASQNNPIQFIGGANNVLQNATDSWEDLGVFPGDTVVLSLIDLDGTTSVSGSGTVLFTDGTEMKMSTSVPTSLTATQGWVYVNKTPQSLQTNFNLIPHTQQDGFESIIDNTVSTAIYNLVGSLGVGSNVDFAPTGNLSGALLGKCNIERFADATDPISGATILNYRIKWYFTWHAYLTAVYQDYFFDNKCLTPIVQVSFYPKFNNTGVRLSNTLKLENDGNSGFRDENFNQGVDNFIFNSFVWKNASNVIIPAFDYSTVSKFEFKVTSATGSFGTNFGLIFFNDIEDLDLISAGSTNSNGNYNHARHTIFAEKATFTATTGQTMTSFLGVNGEQYTISDIDISVASGVATVKGTITPNAQFIAKFDDVNNTEKTFCCLFRCETASFGPKNYSTTVNNLVWRGEGAIAPNVLGAFKYSSKEIYDHVRNIVTDLSTGDKIIIEDDNRIKYVADLDKNVQYDSITIRNIVQNTVTGEWFELEHKTISSFNNTILIDGSTNITFSENVSFNIPATGQNAHYYAARFPAFDTPTTFRVNMDLPWINRWEHWLIQNGVSPAFANPNKDWRMYQIPDWELAIRVELATPNGSYVDVTPYIMKDYDDEPTLTQVWEFERMNGQIVTNPLIGEIVYVRCKYTTSTPFITLTWAQTTVEPFESGSRFMISTVYSQGQTNNPLKAVTGAGDKLKLTITSATTFETECLFDPTLINTQNGVSFTNRINLDGAGTLQERTKIDFELVQLPNIPPNSGKKIDCCECLPAKVMASTTDSALYKNDIKGVFHKKDVASDTCVFKIFKEDNPTPLVQYGVVPTFPHDANLIGFCYNWREYLVNYGVGCYRIEKDVTIAGLSFTFVIGKYLLHEFDNESAEGTVRVIGQYDKEVQYVEHGAVKVANFSGSTFETSLRFDGFFGRWQPNSEVVNHYAHNGMLRNAKIRYNGEYQLTMNATTICEYEPFVKELLLFSSIIKCSDYNFSNPNQRQEVIWTVLNDENSINVEYYDTSRMASVNVSLRDLLNNEVSRFDGSITPIKGVTYQMSTIEAGGATPIDILINGNYFDTFTSNQNINIVDQNGSTVPATLNPPNEIEVFVPPLSYGGWVRNPDWTPLPVPLSSENKAYILLAVYPQNFSFSIDLVVTSCNLMLDWGDTTSLVVTSGGTFYKNYSYPTLSGPIKQDSAGRDYKQVIIEVNQVTAGTWDRMFIYGHLFSSFVLDMAYSLTAGYCHSPYNIMQERLIIVNNGAIDSLVNAVYMCKNLRILDVRNSLMSNDLSQYLFKTNARWLGNTTIPNVTDLSNAFYRTSGIDARNQVLDLPVATNCLGIFNQCNCAILKEINVPSATSLSFAFYELNTYDCPKITTSNALTDISYMFSGVNVNYVEITDCTGVTNTTGAFGVVAGLKLNGLTVGFDISGNKLSDSSYQDLFNSLGSASGAQNIIVTGGLLNGAVIPSTWTIATGKGYTLIF